MNKSYKSLAGYYDLIFQQKNYEKEADFIYQIKSRYKQDAAKILDVGCGTGEHLNLLKDKFEILQGVDLNKEIIKAAKKKSSKIKYAVAGMADFKFNQKFDIITCLYSVFNYNLTLEEADRTIKNFKEHLAAGGILIIALYKPMNTKKEISIHTGKKNNIEVAKINQFSIDNETNIETSDFIVLIKKNGKVDFSIENGHKMKIFQLEEFSELLRTNKFEDISVYDNFTDTYAVSESKYPVFVARKSLHQRTA